MLGQIKRSADLLAQHEVQVWYIDLDGWPVARRTSAAGLLSADEKGRAERFRLARDRHRFIVARAALRRILASYLRVDPAHLEFTYGPLGKPVLAGAAGKTGLQFNLSHSDGLALCSVAQHRAVGIDVERMRPFPHADDVMSQQASSGEYATYKALPGSQRLEAFWLWWTRKEAFVKATGDGLSQPLDEFEVSFAQSQPARLIHLGGDIGAAARWSLASLAPAPGFIAAVAVERLVGADPIPLVRAGRTLSDAEL